MLALSGIFEFSAKDITLCKGGFFNLKSNFFQHDFIPFCSISFPFFIE